MKTMEPVAVSPRSKDSELSSNEVSPFSQQSSWLKLGTTKETNMKKAQPTATYDKDYITVSELTKNAADRLRHDGFSLSTKCMIPFHGRPDTLWLILRALAEDGYKLI